MFVLLKIVLILSLWVIAYQDIKERKVYLAVLLAVLFLTGSLHYQHSLSIQFLATILLNTGVVLFIIFILFLYARFKLKLAIQDTIGLGDLLFFITIAVGFPTITFAVLFSFSLLFSLAIFLTVKKHLKHKTVPLAGFQALFFSLIFLLNWALNFINLYQF